MKKNIKWKREEGILLIELFFKTEGRVNDRDKKVIELSNYCRKIHNYNSRDFNESFRNPTGIVMKLKNILYIHTHGQEGLGSYSKLDKELYDEFKDSKEELKNESNLIKNRLNN